MTVPVGITLQPDEPFLDLLAEAVAEADYYEVAPETLWRDVGDGELVLEENGFHRRFAALARETGKPFVAHGVGLSLGAAGAADASRCARWLDRIRRDHATFAFRWYTDHLGTSAPTGLAATLPLPLPMTTRAAHAVARSLAALSEIVPDVGVENTAQYFVVGDPLDEPRFLAECLRAPRAHLLLDLHNVFTMAENFGFDPEAYVARLDTAKVIEIHLSGGSPSDPSWLPSGRVLRLDGHDDAVPEAVWRLFEAVAPRCPALRGVTLERMEGTVHSAADAAVVRDELRRARAVLRSSGSRTGAATGSGGAGAARHEERVTAGDERTSDDGAHDDDTLAAYETILARVVTSPDPVSALATALTDPALPSSSRGALDAIDRDGLRIAALLVARLRFERLVRGCPEAEAWFDRDPAGFAGAFRRYHAEVPPTAFVPPGEARLFRGWLAASEHVEHARRALSR